MTVLQTIAFVALAVAAFVSWSWYSKSKNKGHLFMAIAFTIAALPFLIMAIVD